MSDLRLIDEFINVFKTGGDTSHFIEIIDQRKPLGLGYGHIYHSMRAAGVIGGFDNRRVLEMGGALPDSYVFEKMKANRWVSVEYSEYIGNQYEANKNTDYSYDNTGWEGYYQKWKLTNGERFDIVYSIAAFEHIHNLNGCLNAISDMLRDGGVLYSYFTPIWSAPNGSHGFHPKQIDVLGSHSHLFFDFCSLQDYLIGNHAISPDQACMAAHELYKNNQINRYSFEEYIKIFESAPFREKNIVPLGAKKISELYSGEKLARINSYYPKMGISCAGFEVVMRK
jgi:SAM-dependent methyltransferase